MTNASPTCSLNQLARRIYDINVANGWYDEPTEIGTRIALIHSEASEILEAARKDRRLEVDIEDVLSIEDDNSFKKAFESAVKDMEESEVADTLIRVLDYAAWRGINIESQVKANLRYNALRGHKHGGKKF